MPNVVEKTARGEVTVDVYTRLLKDRIIWLGEKIDTKVANEIMAELLFLEHDDPEEDVFMYINSPGGSVDAAMGIYDTMQFIQPNIVTICAGGSYSMATLLLCAGTEGKRYALPNATIHQYISRGDVSDYTPNVQVNDAQLKRLVGRVYRAIALHTKQPLEKVEADFQTDNYLTAEEALEYGFIDEIITKSLSM